MTENRRTVVPFERSAAYWATRARRHYRPERLPDAARLMRKALEKSGNAGLALELAQIYAGMGCYTAAERCLVRAAARGGLTGGVCFALAQCALNRGREELAEDALEASLRLDPAGLWADRAQELLETYPWPQGEYLPRGARSETLCRLARQRLAEGRQKEAFSLARRAWEKKRSYETAMLMGALLPPGPAIPYFSFAARRRRGRMQPWLLLSRACYLEKRGREAHESLARARRLCDTISQAEAFCQAAWEQREWVQALALIQSRLRRLPASVDWLRLKYVTLKRAGNEEGANRALETLLEADPDDAAGLWYRRHPGEKKLYSGGLTLLDALECQIEALPRRLTPGPLNRLLHLMVMVLMEDVEPEVIYRLLPPLWRRLPPLEKRLCDEQWRGHYPLAFALHLLLATGQKEKARDLFVLVPGKKRLIRTLRRFAGWMKEE